MTKQTRLYTCLSILIAVFCNCSTTKNSANAQVPVPPSNLTDLKYTVEEVPEWTALLKRTSGWFGADGIFAIPYNGKENAPISNKSKNLILFSDSMIGEIEDGKPKNSKMVHNTVAILTGDEPKKENINFYWATNAEGKPETIFIPHTPTADPKDYYWLGDGFINTEMNNTTYIFAYRMRNMDPKDDWSFKLMKTDIMALPAGSVPPFKDQRQIETPLGNGEGGSFGAGILVNTKVAATPHPDGYVYVYGIKGKNKSLIASRVLPKEFEDFSKWRFWDGKEWNADMQQVANITDGVSGELSVSPLPDGRYILVFTLGGMSDVVAMKIGASPVGPFGPVNTLYKCPEVKENKHYITYNAKAHPSLSKPGELLITYNVNTYNFGEELAKNPQLYRPHFIRIKYQ